MKIQRPKQSIIVTLLCLVLIAAGTYRFLYAENSDVMFTAQLRSYFNDTPEFFHECMRKPLGLFTWMGCWATQLFYEPSTGCMFLAAIWAITFIALKQGLRLSGYLAPLALLPFIWLLGEDICKGYDIYTLPATGYMFKDSFVLLFASLVVWLLSAIVGMFFKPQLSIVGKLPEKLRLPLGIVLLAMVGIGGWFYLDNKNFKDEAYHAECKVYRCIDEQRWDDALDIIGTIRCDATRELVIMKNIALLNNGTSGDQMYHYDDFGVLPNTGDTAKVIPMVETSGPLIYLHHGMTNFAKRWAMENSVRYSMNFAFMKVMLMASLADGDLDVAEKYINILSHTMYYKEWAEKYRPITKNPKLIAKYPEFRNILELYSHRGNQVDSDGGKCENYLINYFSKTRRIDSDYMQKVCMLYALVSKDIQTFWPQFMLYAHYHDEMPTHYQEAAYLYGKLEPQSMDISHMPFDKEKIIDRYEAFNQRAQQLMQSGLQEKALAEAMRSEFGNTFWWAYYFNRGSKTY